MKKSLLLLGFAMLFSFAVIAQKGSISGTVIDKKNNESLIGASVLIKNTTNGTTTNLDGKFEISNIEAGKVIIVTSLVGYNTIETEVQVASSKTTTITIDLFESLIQLDELVITGVVNPKSALESSVSITSLKPKSLEKLGATNTAEVFKSIPGIHSESTGGEGNANISVRGVPISTGGAKFLQLHEDGLPVLQFGDIIFGNADMFVRADQTLARIEAIRGGSASTFASNSPAGIINFISKTGATQGGTVGISKGIDYDDFRADFNFGAPIGNGWSFNVGGFYRQGEGPRKIGYDGNMGGQIKANITKEFDKGYARLYFKHLDDRAVSYMPMPVLADGTSANPNFQSINGFDLRTASLQSSDFFNMMGIDASGNPRTTNISDGMHPVSDAIGSEFQFDMGDGWKMTNKNRLAITSGAFRTMFPKGLIGSADAVAQDILGASYAPGYKFSYANGANSGIVLSDNELANLNGNGLLMEMASFDVDINSFNNFTNDLYVSKRFNDMNVTLGYYNAYQQIATYWNWQGYITDVSAQPRLLNITSADGSYYTEGGVTDYGQWGLGRKYDMKYKINAPYANFGYTLNENINIDGSLRYDFGKADGYYLTSKVAGVDVNQDGNISPVEAKSNIVDNERPHAVSYDYGYLSYSLGANYKIDNGKAIYGRISRGGRANADRLLYSQFITSEGKTMEGLEADMITQVEAGFKYNSPTLAFTVTPFYSNVQEQNADITEQKIYLIGFRSLGAEIESSVRLGNFVATAGAVFTDAKITSSLDANEVGKTPRRVPTLMYNFNPTYRLGKADFGLSFIGTTKVYAQNDNEIVLPGYVYVNAYASYDITKGLVLSANVNNLFNTLGFTEAEGYSFQDNATNYMRARPITGRLSKISLTYNF